MNNYKESNDELIRRAHSGDSGARDELISQNVGLVHAVVRRFLGRGHEADDLFQIGCIGLIKAADKFDSGFGVVFSTYAVPMIIGEIKRFMRDDGIIKVSRAYKTINYKAASVRERFAARNGREPKLCEIAAELGITSEELSAALDAVRMPESIFAAADTEDNSGKSLAEKLSTGESYEHDVENRLLLDQAFSGMDEREKLIIYLRYFCQKTQAEIGERLGISQVQVSRLEKRALRRMRDRLTG